jgi:type II secretory pathway component PulF
MKDLENYGTFGNKINDDRPYYTISAVGWWSPVATWTLRFLALVCLFLMGIVVILAIFLTPEEAPILNTIYYKTQKPLWISKETGFTITRVLGAFIGCVWLAIPAGLALYFGESLKKDYKKHKKIMQNSLNQSKIKKNIYV